MVRHQGKPRSHRLGAAQFRPVSFPLNPLAAIVFGRLAQTFPFTYVFNTRLTPSTFVRIIEPIDTERVIPRRNISNMNRETLGADRAGALRCRLGQETEPANPTPKGVLKKTSWSCVGPWTARHRSTAPIPLPTNMDIYLHWSSKEVVAGSP